MSGVKPPKQATLGRDHTHIVSQQLDSGSTLWKTQIVPLRASNMWRPVSRNAGRLRPVRRRNAPCRRCVGHSMELESMPSEATPASSPRTGMTHTRALQSLVSSLLSPLAPVPHTRDPSVARVSRPSPTLETTTWSDRSEPLPREYEPPYVENPVASAVADSVYDESKNDATIDGNDATIDENDATINYVNLHSTANEKDVDTTATIPTLDFVSVPPNDAVFPESPPDKHPIVSRMIKCLNDENRPLAMETLYELQALNRRAVATSQTERVDLQPGIAKGLFRLMGSRRPFDLYQILVYYTTLTTTLEYMEADGDISAYARMYNRVCDAMRHLDPLLHTQDDGQRLVRSVWHAIRQLDRSGQELCLPTFVSAMVAQKYYALGAFYARPAYDELVRQNITVPNGFWVHLLTYSRFNRQSDLPFEDVLHRMVDAGRRPRPVVVLNALDNFFPFTNTATMSTALKAILRLQQAVVASARDQHHCVDVAILKREQFYVDIRTLEMIGAAAASQGHSDVNLLVWDMLDVLGYQPSEAIYENTVTAFAMNTFTYREAFTVLAEMEARGFVPSRALIRSFSIHVRDSKKNLDFAFEQLRQLRYEGKPVTTAALNVIMSGAAECGDIDRILSLFQEFDRNEVKVDADTFSFCFESLGKNLMRRKHNPVTSEHTNACLIAAESFLTLMENRNIEPNHHIIRNYLELLCEVGQIDTASAIVVEAAASEANLVCSKTIYRVALANAKLRQFDVARQVASCLTGEPIPFVLACIEREEQQIITSNEQMLLEERDRLRNVVAPSMERATDASTTQSTMFWSSREGQTSGKDTMETDSVEVSAAVNEERFQRRHDQLDDPAA